MSRREALSFLCCVFAVGFTLFAVILHRSYKPSAAMLRTEAVLTDCEEYCGRGIDPLPILRRRWYVDFTADGQEYRHVLLNWSSNSYARGKNIAIFYDPADPCRIQADVSGIRHAVTAAASACWGILILQTAASAVKRRNRNQNETGATG